METIEFSRNYKSLNFNRNNEKDFLIFMILRRKNVQSILET